jgi:death-on-curing protein
VSGPGGTAKPFGGIVYLSLEDVLQLHEDTIAIEGGASGIRDHGLLASAVEMPQASFAGVYLHESLAEKAAAYLYHLCQNHAFVDGNKRAAAFASIVFLRANGVPVGNLPPQEMLEKVTLLVASGAMEKEDVAPFFDSFMRD